MIDITETVYRGASKGRGLVVSPRGLLCTFSIVTPLTGSGRYLCALHRLFDTLQILDDLPYTMQ